MTLAQILAKKNAPATAEGRGIRITPESEKAALAASIKQTLDASTPVIHPKANTPATDRRELGAMTAGERVPMDHPQQGAPDADWEWFDSLHSFETDLCVVMDPDGLHAWLGLISQPLRPPLLLRKLPLVNRASKNNPF